MTTVVFIDDEIDLCELYEENYSNSEMLVKAFTDLITAEKFILSNKVSIVFIDYRMPKLNGFEFRKKLPPELPCYLVTGEFLKEIPEGFLDIVEKPLQPEIFEAILSKHKINLKSNDNNFNPYRALFENMEQEVHIWKVVKDSKGRIKTWVLVDANQTALGVWEKKIEEVVGKTTEEIFPNTNAVEKFMPVVEKIFKDGKPLTWREYFKGTNQLLEMTSIPCGEYFISTGGSVKKE
jgi:response regulator RpfG family c-di-GMP phosphodiesterase